MIQRNKLNRKLRPFLPPINQAVAFLKDTSPSAALLITCSVPLSAKALRPSFSRPIVICGKLGGGGGGGNLTWRRPEQLKHINALTEDSYTKIDLRNTLQHMKSTL